MQCHTKSKRSQEPCRRAAMRRMTVSYMHGRKALVTQVNGRYIHVSRVVRFDKRCAMKVTPWIRDYPMDERELIG